MKRFYKLLVALSVLGSSVHAQIQKISYTTAEQQVLKLNRISPAGSKQPNKISLDGTWQFSTDVNLTPCDKNIQVPGEWVMQGFEVQKRVFAGYKRTFEIPTDWKNKRVKLRFDAVFSEAEIWLNGKKAASHLGGFTPFEIDINNFVKWNGSNELLVKVKSDSKADSLASASEYAVHPLGGISRKVYLMGIAPVNFAYADVKTLLDKKYENATLSTDVIIANEQNGKADNLSVKAELFKADGTSKVGEKVVRIDKGISKGEYLQQNISFEVLKPAKWDPEHPNLYVVKLSIMQGDKIQDVITKSIGFRQIEVRGNRVFVNNMPVKLRGVCHHETMPLRGRSVNDNMWEKDIQLFREGNVNYIRTSHYPPAEELVDACNRLGMFLEVEAPFCWAQNTAVVAGTELYQALLVDQTMDMMNYFRSDPSVLIWSLGNESLKYKEYFKETGKLVKQFDPTRPRNFSQWGPDADEGDLEIANHHYPGPTGPEKYNNYKRPIVFDEYVHLNAYNRLELVTDPGVRDAWGIGFEAMWEQMYKTDAVLGGAIWAAIDDTFFLPNGKTVGYGTWGPLDGWRREKPEYWHMKKIYSPVKIKLLSNWSNGKIAVELENRLLFSNLNECKIEWNLAGESGRITADLKRNGKTTVMVAVDKKPLSTDKMTIKVYDPRGVLVDIYQFAVVPSVSQIASPAITTGRSWTYSEKGSMLTAKNGTMQVVFNLIDGDVTQVTNNGKNVWNGGARLMVLPLTGEGNGVQMTGDNKKFDPFTDVCKNRIVKEIKLDKGEHSLVISVTDMYTEAAGITTYNFTANGMVNIAYKYTIKKDVNPRQWGLVFGLPSTFQELDWSRNGLWDYYPTNHIGRTAGKAKLMSDLKISGPAGPSTLPTTPWSLDRNELGTNDFRSTKMYINRAQLTNGSSTFDVISNGLQHIRAWRYEDSIKALVAGYSNMGTERFFRDHAAKMDRPLKAGDLIQDNINLQLK
ncbi:glycoside hydrolase family 2 TIM barrel-domain containing protein [Pedobacter nyackensis]|uniref:glycoside hydrolase family 2 TIM barrel-domain containing protein n=1 Tax=Pedobacter nyackensis TaxID=475255 RepID=UPI00292F057E|nr:glycoside hydrolase family 2 TIM barrel-domain containing protein [Pedobacter nyackensis]